MIVGTILLALIGLWQVWGLVKSLMDPQPP